MDQKNDYTKRLAKARKRVEDIKKFHRHLRVYVIINILLLITLYLGLDYFGDQAVQDSGFNDWFVWNVFGTPILWGIGLLLHAFYVFKFGVTQLKKLKPKFLKDWEARQIQKYMDEENENANRYR